MIKKASKPEDNEAEHPKEGASQSVSGAQGEAAGGTGAAPNGGGGGDGGGGGGGGGESRGGSRDDIKNNKDNQVSQLIYNEYVRIIITCKISCIFLNHQQDGDTSLSTHRLSLTMLIKIVKSLGCAYGCGEGHRGLSGDRLRMQVKICV